MLDGSPGLLAAERRQTRATAEGRGFNPQPTVSRRAAKDSFAALRLTPS